MYTTGRTRDVLRITSSLRGPHFLGCEYIGRIQLLPYWTQQFGRIMCEMRIIGLGNKDHRNNEPLFPEVKIAKTYSGGSQGGFTDFWIK